MEIIMISDSKLKIMLCEEDLRRFELSANELDYSNTETKRMFWDILNRAKHENGFDTDGHRVLVQLYPSKDGGCELFVTKMGALECEDDIRKNTKNSGYDKLYSDVKRKKKGLFSKGNLSVFGFESIDDLLSACRKLSAIGYVGESSAYKCDNGRNYLFLSDIDSTPCAPLSEISFITEYGTKENADILKYYICEHGQTICEGSAVSALGSL